MLVVTMKYDKMNIGECTMKNMLISIIFLLTLSYCVALDPPIRVEQYQTAADTRLYFVFNTPHFWPLTDFDRWEIVISDMRLGNHPPYIGALTTLSDQNYPDPEFRMPRSVKLQEGILYYARAFIWTNYGIFDNTTEFTFTIGTEQEPIYRKVIPFVVTNVYDWNTSFVFTNANADIANINVNFFYQTGGSAGSKIFTLLPNTQISFYPSNYPADFSLGAVGWMEILSNLPIRYDRLMVYDADTMSFAAMDSGELEKY